MIGELQIVVLSDRRACNSSFMAMIMSYSEGFYNSWNGSGKTLIGQTSGAAPQVWYRWSRNSCIQPGRLSVLSSISTRTTATNFALSC
ncbi:hypothetical protein AGR1A_pAt10052 [Agrobacterium fabacearum CFBP 5771]|nr:hypothetical protein AGR1A_pAt10052 [Agrobacterium fabacearum CFBP 5771]